MVFPSIVLAGKPSEEGRTANGPVSFHQHRNSRYYTSNHSTHEFINILLDIQSETYIKIKSIKQQTTKRTRQIYIYNTNLNKIKIK